MPAGCRGGGGASGPQRAMAAESRRAGYKPGHLRPPPWCAACSWMVQTKKNQGRGGVQDMASPFPSMSTACLVEEEGAQDVSRTFFLFLLPFVFFLLLYESSFSASTPSVVG